MELLKSLYLSPQQLELTAANENILMDNIEIFKKNGFDFSINSQGNKFKFYSTTFICFR